MNLQIDLAWLISIYLLTLRIGALLMLSPAIPGLAHMLSLRIFLTISLSVALVSGLGCRVTITSLGMGDIILLSLAELVLGATMGLGVFCAFAVFSTAGKILDVQTGFGIGNVFDPITNAGAPLFTTVITLLGGMVFLNLNSHHALVRGVAYSVSKIPLGHGFTSIPVDAVIAQFGLIFSLGITIIAPVIAILLLTEAAFSVLSRILPQMNVFMLAIPVKIGVGLSMLALTSVYVKPTLSRIFGAIFIFWERILNP